MLIILDPEDVLWEVLLSFFLFSVGESGGNSLTNPDCLFGYSHLETSMSISCCSSCARCSGGTVEETRLDPCRNSYIKPPVACFCFEKRTRSLVGSRRALTPFFFNPSPCAPGILIHVASACLCFPSFLKCPSFPLMLGEPLLSKARWEPPPQRLSPWPPKQGFSSSLCIVIILGQHTVRLRRTGTLTTWHVFGRKGFCFFMLVLTERDKHMA